MVFFIDDEDKRQEVRNLRGCNVGPLIKFLVEKDDDELSSIIKLMVDEGCFYFDQSTLEECSKSDLFDSVFILPSASGTQDEKSLAVISQRKKVKVYRNRSHAGIIGKKIDDNTDLHTKTKKIRKEGKFSNFFNSL